MLLALPLLNSGCSGTPASTQYANLLRRAEVETISRAMQEEIEKHYTVLQHKLVNGYVNYLGQAIISHNPQMPPLPYQFRVLRSNEVNVFSLPGGISYLTLGVLSQFEFEGEVAAALAHELAHHDAGHSLILWRDRIANGDSGINVTDSRKDGFERYFFQKGGLLYYGDAYELEADEVALVILYQGGYDPRIYVSYLESLRKMQLKSPKLVGRLLALHPPLDKRLEKVKEYLKLLPPKRESKVTDTSFKEIKHLLKLADKMKTTPKQKKDNSGDEQL